MKLTCDDFVPFIDAYTDGEFDGLELIEADAHLEHCDACRTKVEFQIHFKRDFKIALNDPPKAPESLKQNILLMLEQEQQTKLHGLTTPYKPARRIGIVAIPAAIVMLAASFILPSFTVASAAAGKHNPITKQTIEWHKGNLPLEVKGDANTVSKWFTGKVNFPVRLPKFANKKSKIIGARLAHIENQRAAYILYDVDGTRLSVMMFQGNSMKVPTAKVKKLAGHDVALMNSNGYEVAVLQNNGVTYTMASELPKSSFVKTLETSLR